MARRRRSLKKKKQRFGSPHKGLSQSFSDYQQMMIRYFQGELKETPWHLGEVDAETVPLLRKLILINSLGFVTIEGQPGEDTNTIITVGKNKGSYYSRIQRGYAIGFIENKVRVPLLRMLNRAGLVFTSFNFRSGETTRSNSLWKLTQSQRDGGRDEGDPQVLFSVTQELVSKPELNPTLQPTGQRFFYTNVPLVPIARDARDEIELDDNDSTNRWRLRSDKPHPLELTSTFLTVIDPRWKGWAVQDLEFILISFLSRIKRQPIPEEFRLGCERAIAKLPISPASVVVPQIVLANSGTSNQKIVFQL